MEPFTGRRLRGYELHEQIGAGGFGAVYKAYQPAIGRQVAVKVILPQHTNSPEFIQRFQTEAKLVAQLEHPHIIPLYDYWQDEEGAFLVMRWLPGGSLRQALEAGAWSPEQTARLLDQIAGALTEAHEARVVHRDIKPDNILLDKRGNAYLTDFGIAKQVASKDKLTASGALIGSPAYLAPEQIQGQLLSPQADIYSLGITLYEILLGERPFPDITPALVLIKHLQDPLPNINEKKPSLPVELNDVIQRATAKDPNNRHPTVQALAADFRQAINPPGDVKRVGIPTAAQPRPIRKKRTHLNPEQRARSILLDKVRSFWVEGVLEQSLNGVALMELGVETRPGAVEHPWEMVIQRLDKQPEILPTSLWIADIFHEMGQTLLILGEPGAGKTTVMLELVRDLSIEAADDLEELIPVVCNLSSWADKRLPLKQWLIDELNSKYLVPKQLGEAWVNTQSLSLMLDGLDEVKAEHREACVAVINQFRAEHGLTPLVVCSRVADYEALTNRLKLEGAILLQPLADEQIDSYLQRAGNKLATLRATIQEDTELRTLANSPLMLSIMTLAYQELTPEDLPALNTIETRRRHLFDTYIQRMFQRRAQADHSDPEHTTRWLAWLAARMRENGQTVFQLENLQPTWLPTFKQRTQYNAYQFLFLFSLGFITSTIFLTGFLANTTDLSGSFLLLVGLYLSFLVAAGIGAAFMQPFKEIELVEALNWTPGWSWSAAWKGFKTGLAIPLIPVGLIAGLLFVSVLLSTTTPAEPLLSISGMYLLYTWGLGLILGVPWGLGAGVIYGGLQYTSVDTRSTPGHGLKRSIKNALVVAAPVVLLCPLLSIPISILFGWSLEWSLIFGLVLGGAIGLAVFLLFGGRAVIQHFSLRFVLSLNGSLPPQLVRFLDNAADLIFLRKVGGGYIFVHRTLLDHFADKATAPQPAPQKDTRVRKLLNKFSLRKTKISEREQETIIKKRLARQSRIQVRLLNILISTLVIFQVSWIFLWGGQQWLTAYRAEDTIQDLSWSDHGYLHRVITPSSIQTIDTVGKKRFDWPGPIKLLSADKSRFIRETNQLHIMSVDTGKPVATMDPQQGRIYNLNWSANGTRLAGFYLKQNTLVIWDAENGEQLAAIPVDSEIIYTTTKWSADGRYLLISLEDERTLVFDLEIPEAPIVVDEIAHSSRFVRFAWSPTELLLSHWDQDDGSWVIWNVQSGDRYQPFGDQPVGQPSWAPTGNRIFVPVQQDPNTSSGNCRFSPFLWDVELREAIPFPPFSGCIQGYSSPIQWAPDNTRFAFIAGDGIKIWDGSSASSLLELEAFDSTNTNLFLLIDGEVTAWSPDGSLLAATLWLNTVGVWDTNSGRLVNVFVGHLGNITALTWSPDSQQLASGDENGLVQVWHLNQ